MDILLALAFIALIALLINAAPDIDRKRQPSWFDLQPYMTASKKQSGRVQQKRQFRKRR